MASEDLRHIHKGLYWRGIKPPPDGITEAALRTISACSISQPFEALMGWARLIEAGPTEAMSHTRLIPSGAPNAQRLA